MTPLWPAGHLPHKGGDRMPDMQANCRRRWRIVEAAGTPISPLVGEMAGGPEGGVFS